MPTDKPEQNEELETESFGELVKYTLGGYAAGLIAGFLFDLAGWQRSGIGQWIVRTLAGEGESIFEGIFALTRRIAGRAGSMAEAYGWGKLIGMTVPWVIDLGSRLAGISVYAVEGFYIPFFYAMSDQIGANLSGFVFLKRKEQSWSKAAASYIRHPVMLASLFVILFVPVALAVARILGFSPTTQVLTALETIAANLCWVPPVVGWVTRK